MLVPHFGDLARPPRRHHGGGHRHRFGRGGGGYPWWYGGYPFPPEPYTVEPAPSNKYVIIDDKGKPIAVVPKVGTLPPGYTFRIATPAEAATGIPGAGGPPGQTAGFGAVVPLSPITASMTELPTETELSDFGDDESDLF